MRKWALFGVGLSVLAAGCGGAETAQQQRSVEDQTLVIALPSQPENLNPDRRRQRVRGQPEVLQRAAALREGPDARAGPRRGAAGAQPRTAGGSRSSCARDVRFHDGTPLTAEDVVFTYNAVLDPDSASPLASLLDSLKSVRAVDATTVEFTLDRPDPAFFDKLQIGIVPAHALAGQDIKTAAFNRKPIGTGPYVIKEFEPGGRIVMEANRDYFRGAPRIKRVVLTAVPDENARVALLEKGAIDAAGIVPKLAGRVRENGRYNVLEVRTADARTLALPTRDPVAARPGRAPRALVRGRPRAARRRRAGRRRRARVRADHEGPLGLQPGRRDPIRPGRGRATARRRGLPAHAPTARAPRARRSSSSRSCTTPPTACARTSRSRSRPTWRRSAPTSTPEGPELGRDQEAPGRGRDGVRLRHPVRPRPRALHALSLEVRDRRRRPVHELPAHPRRAGSTRCWTASARRSTRRRASGCSPTCRPSTRATRAGCGSCGCVTSSRSPSA